MNETSACAWRGVSYTTVCDKVCQWLAAGLWFSPGTPVSSTNKTDHHDIAEILLKVALDIIPPFRYCQEGLIKQNDIIVLSF